ncbi:putative membrane protein [Paraburkholderia sp. CI2]|uniref:DUF4870 family protein n=1 Tax=unclassified Paraburkholderia TaxID=2615204 RepID=UPI001613322D|nr:MULTISPECIES: hypothetical protein [unclassified Paraburkholderia]MBB5412379.1 putative membrane protein [Paraburkholderia sp. HC6.4b]MBB5454408.1 putative membrane protein [Paraburkholderia sp. Kb1A]MBB5468333.1 putative membrane protein [Paraburkholderia sp. CI2]MBC8724435.1 hypothetical protein [Paraburkholderia sp. 31.1]MBC8738764.1 hypothetical protein [Paraburkholderia sp. UCT31]
MEQPQGSYPPPVYRHAMEPERERSLRTLTHVLYALYAVHWLTGGLTILVAIIINYVKRSDVAGTPYEAHFEWQIRTFWLGLVGYAIGALLLLVVIGIPVLWAVSIWMLYRIIKGWLYLYDNKSFANPASWV